MAKTPRAALTRIAATVTARYYQTSGATDGFYLDGRISGRREHRAADITLDREERGFFYAAFAHLPGSNQDDAAQTRVRKALDRILSEVKQPGHNIDTEINELAECAVSVAGRITLQHDGVRQPYFAGIIVKDSELAAVTMGNGCAYLYRGDVLYPLTADDYQLDAIDYNGKPVSGLDVYCAGVAGTVRYSNIAQLQLDDCVIVCNKEIMEALGQREVLRMLYEAEDQSDAAGLIITAASAKLPGVPLQILIGFVENISSLDRTGRFNVTRTQPDVASSGSSAGAAAGRTGSSGAATGAFAAVPAAKAAEEYIDDEIASDDVIKPAQPGRQNRAMAGRGDRRNQVEEIYEADDDDFGDERGMTGRGRRIAFYVIIAVVCIGCLFAIYNMLFGNRDSNPTTTTTTTTISSTATTATTSDSTTTTGTTTSTTETTTGTTATTSTKIQLPTDYTVKSGDTLYGIAQRFYGSGSPTNIQLIKDANSLTSDNLQVGDILTIPAKP